MQRKNKLLNGFDLTHNLKRWYDHNLVDCCAIKMLTIKAKKSVQMFDNKRKDEIYVYLENWVKSHATTSKAYIIKLHKNRMPSLSLSV